jgi:protein-S-isoprenylcysteine O-methyltransferase Ste14
MDLASEPAFRVATGCLLTSGLAVRSYFKRQSARAERASVRHEERERRFYNLVLASYLFCYGYVLSTWLDFAHFDLPAWLRWVGAGALLGATGLLWWTHRALGRNFSGVLEIRKGHALVTRGPYRLVRHPMYLAFFVFGFGLLLLAANWLIAGANLAVLTWMYLVRAPEEERMLAEHFGDAYSRYMQGTGRLLPRLRA